MAVGESKATVTASRAEPDLSKPYDPKAVEPRTYQRWESAGYFHEEPDPARPPFIICMPPPNVTGRAHLGHGSTYVPMDALVRYHRMLGDNADWLPGTDHAAIATEAVVVRELAKEGQTRESLGREKYLQRAWAWAREFGGTIDGQFRALGFGPDWARSRFTMDEGLSAAVRRVFVSLYRDGLVYRGKRLVNWDPQAHTTISDAEVEHADRDAHLWYVRYPFGALTQAQDDTSITVATTRPETILGDVAIAVHPADERYRSFVGKHVLVPPLCERAIPVIADEAVDPAFGTGAVKVTPAHDATDYEIGVRHDLPMPSVLDLDACVTGAEIAVGPYAGLQRETARKRIVDDLRARGLLAKEEPYRHSLAVSERTGAAVEPLLSEQWFVKMKPLAEPALRAYREGKVTFFPERYGRTYEQWLENIRDWNVSRQVWWGHQLPVWYTPDGSVVVAETEEEAREIARREHGTQELRRDPDTLDTWFSSALWPFSILGWPAQTPELRYWYPSQVLVTGWEIIFLWVARMVMMGMKFLGEVPFPHVVVTPLVFDAQGRKMSKSLGNAIDPIELVGKYGADAFRLGVMRQMRLEGQEIRFQESRCEEARNFNNKIWNAARFVLTREEGLPPAMTLPARDALTVADAWILERLYDTVIAVSSAFEGYDFGAAAETIWKFLWYDFCDWYLESCKERTATRAAVLSFVFNNAMRLLHPISPFISEELWLALPHDGASIVTSAWPDSQEIPHNPQRAGRFELVRACVERLRTERTDLGIPPRERAPVAYPAALDGHPQERDLLALLVNAQLERAPEPATGELADLLAATAVRLPREKMLERYRREMARLRGEVERGEKKLANEKFVAHARADVVAKEREKLSDYRSELARVRAALAQMGESA